MLLDFYLLAAAFFHGRLRPMLADCWRRRSFEPAHELCAEVFARGQAVPPDCLAAQVRTGLPFTRATWHALAGELLLLSCDDMPLLQTAPATLCCLLAPERYRAGAAPRSAFAPIQQVHFGSCDLRFGGAFYRPEQAGYNDVADVARLLAFLQTVDPAGWSEALLRPMAELDSDEERAEELAFVRDWWPALVELYQGAARRGCVVVCEIQ